MQTAFSEKSGIPFPVIEFIPRLQLPILLCNQYFYAHMPGSSSCTLAVANIIFIACKENEFHNFMERDMMF